MTEPIVTVKILLNGPARIFADRTVIELPDGSTVVKEGPFSLCRCGQSNKKPFCDGTHKSCGFQG